jgi:hypothetical protein
MAEEEEKRTVVHLQCPLCAHILQHFCLGRREVFANELTHVHEEIMEVAHHDTAAAAPAAAVFDADEENLASSFVLNPEFAARFEATAQRRAQRKRQRQQEDKDNEERGDED